MPLSTIEAFLIYLYLSTQGVLGISAVADQLYVDFSISWLTEPSGKVASSSLLYTYAAVTVVSGVNLKVRARAQAGMEAT